MDIHRSDVTHHYVRALTLAAHGDTWPLFDDVGDQGPSSADFAAPWRVAARVQALVHAVGRSEWDTPAHLWGSSVGLREGQPERTSAATFHRALWGPPFPNPTEGIADWVFSRPALRMHHEDAHVQFCGAGLVLRGPGQMLPRPFLEALSVINSVV
mmetsp:Transcript_125693/g.217938  ORF Transcript_125693/g.217938 Transcript_125693/m.217938 type:complete len:156 (-) Transcript_125693:50-517(-)